jgi:predicted dehydrogenase
MAASDLLNASFDQPFPQRTDRGIGIVGAGGIVNAAHLPAYRKAGLNVRAIADLDREAAIRTAAAYEIPVVCETFDELIERKDVEIVDIAVTPMAQTELAAKAVVAGKHVLCQKPLSETYEAAESLVATAHSAGVRLAVNQQLRWDQMIRFTKALVEAGQYGELTSGLYDIDIFTDWSMWPWISRRPRLEYFYHSIHYLDSIRFIFGEPTSLVASVARYPGQEAKGESRSYTILEYRDTLRVVVLVNHNNWSSSRRAIVRCHGTEGQSEGTLGSLYDYPYGRPDTFGFVMRGTEWSFSRTFTERWIPDAFIGPMAELMCAIEEDREPLTNGRDNLKTLALIHAAYRSVAEGRRVVIDDRSESTVVSTGE